jgi:hypothetical protein
MPVKAFDLIGYPASPVHNLYPTSNAGSAHINIHGIIPHKYEMKTINCEVAPRHQMFSAFQDLKLVLFISPHSEHKAFPHTPKARGAICFHISRILYFENDVEYMKRTELNYNRRNCFNAYIPS